MTEQTATEVESVLPDDKQRVEEVANAFKTLDGALGARSALEVMLAAATAEDATEDSILAAVEPFLPEKADTGRLRVLARHFIREAGHARVRVAQRQEIIAAAIAGYPYNVGPAPVIIDAAPFLDRPSIYTMAMPA